MIIKKSKNKPRGEDIPKQESEQVEVESEQEEQIEVQEEQNQEQDIDLFDLDNIDFKQRQERRRGDRRRGFRRIDDRNLISRAKEEANSIREAAQQEGYQEGLNAAQDDIQALRDGIEQFFGAKQEILNSIAPDILEISLDIAKKIIKKEAAENPDVILENIKEVLKDLSKEETKITLKVNPAQVALLKQKVPEAVSMAGLEAKVLIVPDENTMEGGCLVTTTNGVIDATIETQVEIISEALKEV